MDYKYTIKNRRLILLIYAVIFEIYTFLVMYVHCVYNKLIRKNVLKKVSV